MSESKPASFTDIAFDTGRIYERERILSVLETDLLDASINGIKIIALSKQQLIELIKGATNDRQD